MKRGPNSLLSPGDQMLFTQNEDAIHDEEINRGYRKSALNVNLNHTV
jgi:hypothetical protein